MSNTIVTLLIVGGVSGGLALARWWSERRGNEVDSGFDSGFDVGDVLDTFASFDD